MASPDSGSVFQWHYGEMEDKNFQIKGRGSVLIVVIVFAFFIILILVCLYAKWAYRYGRLAAEAQGSATAGLDKAAINSLPVRTVGSSAAGDESCSICLSNLAKGEKVKVLPACNHGFHSKCIDKWLKGQASCPICRASLAKEPTPPVAAMV